jgi:hypothetical protein
MNTSDLRMKLKKKVLEFLCWRIVKLLIAFSLGAVASNLDRLLDLYLHPANWDCFIKCFSRMIGG